MLHGVVWFRSYISLAWVKARYPNRTGCAPRPLKAYVQRTNWKERNDEVYLSGGRGSSRAAVRAPCRLVWSPRARRCGPLPSPFHLCIWFEYCSSFIVSILQTEQTIRNRTEGRRDYVCFLWILIHAGTPMLILFAFLLPFDLFDDLGMFWYQKIQPLRQFFKMVLTIHMH